MNQKQDNMQLAGKTIICTHPHKDKDIFAEILREQGAVVLNMPTIQVTPLPFSLKDDLEKYDWIVFTSKNAVPVFLENIKPLQKNKFAVIGRGTADELENHGITPDYIGEGKSGEDFTKEFSSILNPGESILLALGSLAPGTLTATLSLEHQVDRVDVYKTTKPAFIDNRILTMVEEDLYDIIIVTSPSAIQNLQSELGHKNSKLKIISIGKTTSAAIRELGYEPVAEANESSYKSLADATIEYLNNNNK